MKQILDQNVELLKKNCDEAAVFFDKQRKSIHESFEGFVDQNLINKMDAEQKKELDDTALQTQTVESTITNIRQVGQTIVGKGQTWTFKSFIEQIKQARENIDRAQMNLGLMNKWTTQWTKENCTKAYESIRQYELEVKKLHYLTEKADAHFKASPEFTQNKEASTLTKVRDKAQQNLDRNAITGEEFMALQKALLGGGPPTHPLKTTDVKRLKDSIVPGIKTKLEQAKTLNDEMTTVLQSTNNFLQKYNKKKETPPSGKMEQFTMWARQQHKGETRGQQERLLQNCLTLLQDPNKFSTPEERRSVLKGLMLFIQEQISHETLQKLKHTSQLRQLADMTLDTPVLKEMNALEALKSFRKFVKDSEATVVYKGFDTKISSKMSLKIENLVTKRLLDSTWKEKQDDITRNTPNIQARVTQRNANAKRLTS